MSGRGPSEERRGWARAGAGLFALGLVALGIFGVLFYATLPRRLPAARDWREVAALLAREGLPGDAVALAPWWAERARQAVPPALPVLALPHLGGEDLPGLRRVWLLAIPAAPGYRRDLARELAARSGAATSPLRIGGLELTRYDLRDPTIPLEVLAERLDAAAIAVGGHACARVSPGAFRCPPSGATVKREVREVEFLPRPCITVHPGSGLAAPLEITFRGVKLGRSLRAHAGVVGPGEREDVDPFRLTVMVDGRRIGGAEERGSWQAFQVDLPAPGHVRDVTFTIRATETERRQLCFDAYVLP